jgi:hypothetical protein
MKQKNFFLVMVLLVGMLSSLMVADSGIGMTTRGKPVKDTLVVTIDAPSDGATVSDVVTIQVTVYDPQGVYNDLVADIYIDNVLVAHDTSYVWSTTVDDNGQHEIKAYSEQTDSYRGKPPKPPKVISDEDVIIVTVDNYVEPPPGGDGDEMFYGTVSYGSDSWHYFDAGVGTIDASLSWGNSYDVDLYLFAPSDYNNYVVRGYTTSNPEVITYEADECGMWGIMARMYTSYSDPTDYELHVTYTPNTPDVTAPTCTIIKPTDGQVVYKTVYVTASATDDRQLDYVEFYIDGSLASTDSVAPYSYPWDTTAVVDGVHTIDATAYDMAGNFDAAPQVAVTVDQSAAPAVDVQKYALITGVSDYKAISDLSYCDEDATDWYNFVTSVLGVPTGHITVLGDGHPSNFPQYDGLATEANTKAALENYVAFVDDDDIIFYITSGHGSGDGRGSSYICSWDCGSGESGEDGDFYDTELAAILGNALASVYVFIDHCYSGGFGPELMSCGANIVCQTTCTDNGYGWDDPGSQNGLWTHWFLEQSWIGQFGSDPFVPVEDVFAWAHDNYPKGGGDEPQEFDTDPSTPMVLG